MALPPPRKRLGQHFLTDPAKIEEIVAAIGPSDTLVEIGPGRGALTHPLAGQAKRLIAIEKDSDLAAHLERQFADNPGVTIRCADALREDLSVYPRGLRLAGNLPYNVATALLQRWMELRTHLADLTVMVQREVAQRLAAPPGDSSRGQLSVVAQLLMQVEMLLDVEPECFDPPPKVVSTVVRLVPKGTFRLKRRSERISRVWFAGHLHRGGRHCATICRKFRIERGPKRTLIPGEEPSHCRAKNLCGCSGRSPEGRRFRLTCAIPATRYNLRRCPSIFLPACHPRRTTTSMFR